MSPLRRQNPREEPGALAAHAGIRAGGEEQSSSLPRPWARSRTQSAASIQNDSGLPQGQADPFTGTARDARAAGRACAAVRMLCALESRPSAWSGTRLPGRQHAAGMIGRSLHRRWQASRSRRRAILFRKRCDAYVPWRPVSNLAQRRVFCREFVDSAITSQFADKCRTLSCGQSRTVKKLPIAGRVKIAVPASHIHIETSVESSVAPTIRS